MKEEEQRKYNNGGKWKLPIDKKVRGEVTKEKDTKRKGCCFVTVEKFLYFCVVRLESWTRELNLEILYSLWCNKKVK